MTSTIDFIVDQSSLDFLLEGQGGEVDDYIKKITVLVTQRAKVTSPRRTAEMAAAHRTERGPGRSWQVVVPVEYALTVHNGRGARTIRPRRKKSLRWRQGGNNGPVIFSKEANQPSIGGNPWLRRALIDELKFLGVS